MSNNDFPLINLRDLTHVDFKIQIIHSSIEEELVCKQPILISTGHNLTGIASQFAMHLGFTCDVISVTHRSD